MQTRISINELPHSDTKVFVNSLVGSLLTAFEDFAFGYDLVEEAQERIIEVLNEHGIPYERITEEVIPKCNWCGLETDNLYELGHCVNCGDVRECYQDYERKDKYND